MKLWELMSVTRDDASLVLRIASSRSEWAFIEDLVSRFHDMVARRDRVGLDQELPDDFVRKVLAKLKLSFYLTRDGRLSSRRASIFDTALSAVEAFDRFGGRALEDALEYGGVRVGQDA